MIKTDTLSGEKEDILGYPVSKLNLSETILTLTRWIGESGKTKFIACLNPHSLVVARDDARYHEALITADILLPDGIGIVLASRVLGGAIRTRVTGPDLLEGTCQACQQIGDVRMFFLGGSESTLCRIGERMRAQYPAIHFSCYSPPFQNAFSNLDTLGMISAVEAVDPDILWVGMTAPKQEKWIAENLYRLRVPTVAAVGAAFDFFAGTIPRSGQLFRVLGLEWLPRMVREPKRLWRRTAVSAPKFLLVLLKARLGL